VRAGAAQARTVRASDVNAADPDYWGTVQSRFAALLAHAMAAGHTHDAALGAEAARAYDALLADGCWRNVATGN
jgi:hypothetical protein